MVITRRRRTIETGIQIIIGAIAWRLLFDALFIGQENGILFSFIGGFIVFLLAGGLFSLRTTFAIRRAAKQRYGADLTLNEVSFLRRHEDPVDRREALPGARAKLSTAQYPQGIVLTDPYSAAWALRDADSRAELAVAQEA